MRRRQNQMVAAVYHRPLFLRVAAPQHKHHVFPPRIDLRNHAVGKRFPAQIRMRMRTVCTHGQHCVQQQHALLCPTRQAAVRRHGKAGNIVCQFLINIYQRRRHGHAFAHRKRQPVRLPFVVIRVLS